MSTFQIFNPSKSHRLLKPPSNLSQINSDFTSPAKAQPSGNEIILICGLGARFGYERIERVFKPPRLKSQIRIISFPEGVYFACGKSGFTEKHVML